MEKTTDKITKLLEKILPENWEKVCFLFEVSSMSYSGDFYVFIKGDQTPQRSYDIIPEDKILKVYDKIFALLNDLKKSKGEFSHYLLEFDRTSCNEHFDYIDIDSEDEDNDYSFFDYWNKWKAEYVGK